jgi:hypothetical protein
MVDPRYEQLTKESRICILLTKGNVLSSADWLSGKQKSEHGFCILRVLKYL